MAPKRRRALGESSSRSSPDLACATLIVKRRRSSRAAAERSRKVDLIDEVCKMFPLIWLNVWLISKSR